MWMGLIESVETLNEKTGVPKKEEIQPPDGPPTQAATSFATARHMVWSPYMLTMIFS